MTSDPGVTHNLAHGVNGKAIDVYRPSAGTPDRVPTVLLWHGKGPDERDVLQPLAETVARMGPQVLVPDWRSDATDGGRSHLLDSLRFARDQVDSSGGDPGRIVLAGWSAGAPAVMGVALRPELVGGWRPLAVVGMAARYDWAARTTDTVPMDDLGTTAAHPVPVWLVHGTTDPVMESRYSEEFADALKERGWPVHLERPDTDHAGVVMAAYDPELDRLRPAGAEHALRGGLLTARIIARACGVEPSVPEPGGR
ncbi:alpha/beta hydrolase [Streptomyces sp. 8N706]|uniref:alpha/beta hydrolase n=1 Tax=Streptomyces sp. 8N706 TaxID=3457416 RepID=UPI003FD188D0